MTNPITPSLALIDQWWDEAKQNAKYDEPIGPLVATRAAQWGADQQLKLDAKQIEQSYQAGADQELEACCEWVGQWCGRWPDGTRPEDELHISRRRPAPSLPAGGHPPTLLTRRTNGHV